MTAWTHRISADKCGGGCVACVFVRLCFAGLCVLLLVWNWLCWLDDGGTLLVRTRGIAEDENITWFLHFSGSCLRFVISKNMMLK